MHACIKVIEEKPELLNLHKQILTIAFWDIRGSSLLCEILKAHPTLVSGFLQDYLRIASEIIFDHEGVLDKFMGDGVMGLFGAFNNDDQYDAKCAIKAAIALNTKFTEILNNWMKQWVLYTPQKIDIGLACGIHTGEVLVGNIGTKMRDQFTALGPHVNFAARLVDRAKRDQILVSTSTKARLINRFTLKKVDTITDVKNIPGSYDIFEIT